jgi:hypothetical protein
MTFAKFLCVFVMALAGGWGCFAQNSESNPRTEAVQSAIAGVWRGRSVCVDKNRPCQDEVNVYRFSRVTGRRNEFSVTASKVVDGKDIVMGHGLWKFDEKIKTVESEKPPIRLTMEGKKMEGTLSLAEGTAYRRIYLEKRN